MPSITQRRKSNFLRAIARGTVPGAQISDRTQARAMAGPPGGIGANVRTLADAGPDTANTVRQYALQQLQQQNAAEPVATGGQTQQNIQPGNLLQRRQELATHDTPIGHRERDLLQTAALLRARRRTPRSTLY